MPTPPKAVHGLGEKCRERIAPLALVCEADKRGRLGSAEADYPQGRELLQLHAAALAVNARDIDNDGITVALLLQGIHWDAVDAVLRGAAFGANGRYWSRQIAEGEAQRGAQATTQKTLEDVLAVAERIAAPITTEGA